MRKRYHFIVNPKSGNSLDVSTLCRMRDLLRHRGHRVQIDLTRSLQHAGELAHDAVRHAIGLGMDDLPCGMPATRQGICNNLADKCPVVIVVSGGDGTIREVAGAIAGRCVPVLIMPAGTENLLAQEIGLDGSYETSVAALDGGKLRDLDLGNVNGHFFMSVVGVGFDAHVVNHVHRRRSGHITPMNYIWPICRTFWEYQFRPIRVEADGQFICEEPGLVFVSNVSRYAAGLSVSPDADCGDGFFDLTVFICRHHLDLLHHSLRTGFRTTDWPGMVIRKICRHVKLSSPCPDIPVEIDGDPFPNLPLEIKVIPASAKMLTPPGPAAHLHCPPVRNYHLKRWVLR